MNGIPKAFLPNGKVQEWDEMSEDDHFTNCKVKITLQQSVLADTYDPSAWETEAGGL